LKIAGCYWGGATTKCADVPSDCTTAKFDAAVTTDDCSSVYCVVKDSKCAKAEAGTAPATKACSEFTPFDTACDGANPTKTADTLCNYTPAVTGGAAATCVEIAENSDCGLFVS